MDDNGLLIVGGVLFDYSGPGGEVIIPEDTRSIEIWAFADCRSLTGITLPDGLVAIGDRAFEGCVSLASVRIPDTVTRIGEQAFHRCRKLAGSQGFVIVNDILFDYFGPGGNVVIPEEVQILSDYAFENRRDITGVKLPEGLRSMGTHVFDGCSAMDVFSYVDNPEENS